MAVVAEIVSGDTGSIALFSRLFEQLRRKIHRSAIASNSNTTISSNSPLWGR